MTEEQIKARKEHAGDKRASMKRRDDHHDYTERRMYMITLEVEGRRPLFGRLTGDAFAAPGSADEPRIVLTALGEAVQSEWLGIHTYYPQIEVIAVQMMPDHMHGILFVRERLPVHLGQVIAGFKTGCRKKERALRTEEGNPAAAQPRPTEKETTTKTQETEKQKAETREAEKQQAKKQKAEKREAEKQQAEKQQQAEPSQQAEAMPLQGREAQQRPLFAQGYNDLILRSYDELRVWKKYLTENPRRLLMKRARPEWLRPFFAFTAGQHSYSGIGNRDLLKAVRRKAVRVSRRLTEAEIEAAVRDYLEEARQGTVLISPAISLGEKRVMRAAFDAGLPTVVIMENGFTPLSKPHGEQFYACAKGVLLMLAPWEHHNERRKLTAFQCTQMNLMAIELAQ